MKQRETPNESPDLSAENVQADAPDAANTEDIQSDSPESTDAEMAEQTAAIEKLSNERMHERKKIIARRERANRWSPLRNALHQRLAIYGINAAIHSAAGAIHRHTSNHPEDRDH